MLSTTHSSSRFVSSNKRVISWITDLSPVLSPWTCPATLEYCLTLVTLMGSDPDPDLWTYLPALPWLSLTWGAWCPGLKIVPGCTPSPYPVPSLRVVGLGSGWWGPLPCQPEDPTQLQALTAHCQSGPSLRKQLAFIFLKQVKISEWVLISYPQVIKIHKLDDGQNIFPFNFGTPLALDYEWFRIASFLHLVIWIPVICKLIVFKVDTATGKYVQRHKLI